MTPQLQCPSASEEKEEELQVCEEVQEHVEHVAEFLDVEPRPGPKALAVEDEVLREVGLHPFAEAGIEASAKALRDVCVRFQLTLLEVEPLLLPPWIMDTAFPSREMFFACLHLEACFQQWPANGENFEKTINNDSMDLFFGELGKTSSFASDSPLFQHPVVGSSNSCRWVELLNGSVLARLMSPDLTGLCLHRLMVPERFRVTQALLAALRRVTWAPEHAFIFPDWHQHGMALISWIGKELGFGMFLWADKVLPFLPIEPYYAPEC